MQKLFGIPMDSIMVVMLAAFVAVMVALGLVGLRNRMMVRLGLRNIPRRRAQTVLIVLGLMLSTLIISSAFGTGDTMTYTIRSMAVEGLGNIDESITVGTGNVGQLGDARSAPYFPISQFADLKTSLGSYDKIDGFAAAIVESAPLVDLTSEQNQGRVSIMGWDPSQVAGFGDLTERGKGKVSLADLNAAEVYLNWASAKEINAHAGDKLQVFIQQTPIELTVKAVVENGGLAGSGPALTMSLSQAQTLFGKQGMVNTIFISNQGDLRGGANLSDDVTKKLRSLLADDRVANELRASLSNPTVLAELDAAKAKSTPKVGDKLSALITELAKDSATPELKSLLGDGDIQAQLKTIIPKLPDKQAAERIDTLLSQLSKYRVDDVKKAALDMADEMGSTFSTLFVGFGLFSISAGVLLIFLIFIMLAAERKSEMGMARAVGMQRRHLIQAFLFEGVVYDLLASAVGAGLGILVGWAMVGLMAGMLGQQGLAIRQHFELRSIVVSYCLGMLLTFITVTISAWRVSRLNIVAAIRDLPDSLHADPSLWAFFLRPFRLMAASLRSLGQLRLRRFVSTLFLGVPRAIVVFWWTLAKRGPLTIVLGVLLGWAGIASVQAFPYSLGVSLVLIGIGLWLRAGLRHTAMRLDLQDRIAYSFAGIALLVYWALPFGTFDFLGLPEFKSGIEMFFLSGIMMVAGAVWTIIYNSDLLLRGMVAALGRFGRLVPIVKTAVAYPMSQKFRTGITLAMFALIVFTIIVMSVIIGSMISSMSDMAVMSGGYDIQGQVSFNNPIPDIQKAIAVSSKVKADDFEAIAGSTTLPVEVRQVGETAAVWSGYYLRVVDNGFLDTNGFKIKLKAAGYATDRDVWKAVKENPGLAVVDSLAVPSKGNYSVVIGAPSFKLSGVYQEDKEMPPLQIEVRDPMSGAVTKLTIIGMLDSRSVGMGIHTSQATMAKAFPVSLPVTTYMFRVKQGVDVKQASLNLGSAFLANGMQAKVIADEINKMLQTNFSMNTLLQGFMGLGLLVGIAALGVISTRAVVERRQQIGVLRAIGYQRNMVQLSFLLESSFVALLGILIGVVLGLVLSYNMFSFLAKQQEGITLSIPWLQIAGIIALSYAASLLTTYLPARQAARTYPAEALRYE